MKVPPDVVQLMLCVNAWRTGTFTGRCQAVSLGGSDVLVLESPYLVRSLTCRVGPVTFGLGKSRAWPHLGHAEWVGNWCWDAVTVHVAVAADVLNYAASKGYRPSVGAVELFGKVERGEPLTAADILAEEVP